MLFKLAVDDIDLALASDYPVDKVFKLYERKGECLHQLSKSTSKDHEEKKALAIKSVEAFRSVYRKAFEWWLPIPVQSHGGRIGTVQN